MHFDLLLHFAGENGEYFRGLLTDSFLGDLPAGMECTLEITWLPPRGEVLLTDSFLGDLQTRLHGTSLVTTRLPLQGGVLLTDCFLGEEVCCGVWNFCWPLFVLSPVDPSPCSSASTMLLEGGSTAIPDNSLPLLCAFYGTVPCQFGWCWSSEELLAMPILHALCRAKMQKTYLAAELGTADTTRESTSFLRGSTLRPMPKGPIATYTSVWVFVECFELRVSAFFVQMNARSGIWLKIEH